MAASTPRGVVTTLLAPALRSIGARWADGDVSVADEHRATAVAQRIIGRLGLQFGRPGRSRGTVIVAAPAGDLHTLPVAMVADLLRWRGFDVVELGANTPVDALAEVAGKADRLVAVGIASTTLGLDAEVGRSIEELTGDGPRRPDPPRWQAPSAPRRTPGRWEPTSGQGATGGRSSRPSRVLAGCWTRHRDRACLVTLEKPARIPDLRGPSTLSSSSRSAAASLGLVTSFVSTSSIGPIRVDSTTR